MDFTIGVVNSSVHNLPDRKETFLGEFKLQRSAIFNAHLKFVFGLVEMTFGQVHATATAGPKGKL